LIRGFINVFSRRATGFHRWAKLFELWTSNITETFLLMIKPGEQNHPHSLSICLVLALDETPELDQSPAFVRKLFKIEVLDRGAIASAIGANFIAFLNYQ